MIFAHIVTGGGEPLSRRELPSDFVRIPFWIHPAVLLSSDRRLAMSSYFYRSSLLAILLVFSSSALAQEDSECAKIVKEFEEYTGAKLVFHRDDLPEGKYHDILKPLRDKDKPAAAKVCLEESKFYPPNYFAEVGLESIGVFSACVSKLNSESWRTFDEQLGGYLYYGVYNGRDAVVAAHYSDGQLAMTIHHEVFHHIDSTVEGETGKWNLGSDDAFYRAAISGSRPYKPPSISHEDLAALRKKCIGVTLKDAVSEYAAKNSREDQAETARHMMTMLANSLVQTVDEPELAGSQRILHILKEYQRATIDGPDIDWFVDVALERANRKPRPQIGELLAKLKEFSQGKNLDSGTIRQLLKSAVRMSAGSLNESQSGELIKLSAKATTQMILTRIRPDPTEQRFDIWGREDTTGVNHTLRRDLRRFAADAERLNVIVSNHGNEQHAKDILRTQIKNLRTIARYYVFIKKNYSVTKGTQSVFEADTRGVRPITAGEERSDRTNDRQNRFTKVSKKTSE